MNPLNVTIGETGVIGETPIPAGTAIDAGSVTWAADNAAAVSLTLSSDGTTVTVKCLVPGTVNISAHATSNGVAIASVAPFTLTIAPPTATGLQLSLVTPFA